MEARVGIEPTIKDLQSSALPLGDRAFQNEMPQVERGSVRAQVKIRLLVSFRIWALYPSGLWQATSVPSNLPYHVI